MFNDFGQEITEYQSRSGAVNTSTTPKVQYGYANGSANTIRPTTLTYPDGRVLTYGYGTTNGTNDAASRVESLVDDDVSATHLADYAYLGLATPVEVDYTEPDVEYTLVGTAGGTDPDTGDIYRGLDRFGRVKDSYWYDYGSSADADRIKYGYDRNGNRLWRENTVAAALGKYFDELYGYDRIDRLQNMDRGQLAALKDSVSNLQFAQDWSLDTTGNWRRFREDDDGAGWDLDQLRTANKVNEITDISESTGPSWVTPAYNRAGNMTTIPKPVDPTQSFTATYDAWNRLVRIAASGSTVAEYEYDGAKRRVVNKTYSSGVLSETRHAYFTELSKWQVIEERVGSSSDAERQFVWGQRYIDDVVLRDRDTDANGSLDERLYGMQDANWNVTALVGTGGTVQERYAYSAYGEPRFLDASFGTRMSSSYAWERLFAAYIWDAIVGWYAVRHRVYVPFLNWVQRDPSADSNEFANLYEYSESCPVGAVDPQGERSERICPPPQRPEPPPDPSPAEASTILPAVLLIGARALPIAKVLPILTNPITGGAIVVGIIFLLNRRRCLKKLKQCQHDMAHSVESKNRMNECLYDDLMKCKAKGGKLDQAATKKCHLLYSLKFCTKAYWRCLFTGWFGKPKFDCDKPTCFNKHCDQVVGS